MKGALLDVLFCCPVRLPIPPSLVMVERAGFEPAIAGFHCV
jgi:hypothetical protein